MANILKTNKTIEHKGMVLNSVYQVIDRIVVDKLKKEAEITYYTFSDKELRDNVNNSLIHGRLTATGEDYDTYFSPTVVAGNGDQFDLAYQWLMTQEWSSAVYDEEGEITTPAVLWSDIFKSDEV